MVVSIGLLAFVDVNQAGVAAIALGVQEKYGVSVPIVPVGLNYFRGHRFRGRVVIEFGAPINITKELGEKYKQSKREAYQQLLQQVEDGMRGVIVTAADYQELKLIHAARRLFQASSTSVSTKEKQDTARRFSLGYKMLKEKYAKEGLPQDLQDIATKVLTIS
jgi:glycerol-3-phosphate O-acyltransferase / dihydroxyacetone phosphate acyltransferase